ncbi:hypothetical protein ABSL23_17325 (plasmid) [Halobacterium sp. NMX12-1]|uniref:Type II toxin-antitoxin system RelE/ParE family toxin n=1 Tax=Halobacterium sp. NMX12-1 TaxID=3166650 RepID=A0AAU8CH30_9EURY
MTREHSLSDTDDGVVIFTDSAEQEIRDLDATQSRDALTAILNCLRNPVPESVIEKTYETCQELQQLRQGKLRIYCKLVTAIPGYNVLWIFAVKKHQYRNLGKFDAQACGKTAELNDITQRSKVESYLSRNQALTVPELEDLKDQL